MGETSKKERKIRNQIGTSFRAFPCAKIRTFSDMAKLFFRVPPRSVSSSGWEGAGKPLFNLSNSRGKDVHSLIMSLIKKNNQTIKKAARLGRL